MCHHTRVDKVTRFSLDINSAVKQLSVILYTLCDIMHNKVEIDFTRLHKKAEASSGAHSAPGCLSQLNKQNYELQFNSLFYFFYHCKPSCLCDFFPSCFCFFTCIKVLCPHSNLIVKAFEYVNLCHIYKVLDCLV